MYNLRWLIASILYFAICFILLAFQFKFSGFMGFITLAILGIGCHAIVDTFLSRKNKKKKEKDTHV